MKYVYSIYLWIVGGLIFFFITLYTIIFTAILKPETLFRHLNFMFRFLFKVLFIRVEVIYEDEVEKDKPHIFMPNHVSFIDVLVAGAYLPVYVNALEAASHFKWFLYGWAIKRFGQIPIERGSKEKSWESFLIAIERLKMGRSIIVFPEGHRSGDGHLQKFKFMPFRFAVEAARQVDYVDLVPTALIGIEKLRQHTIWIKPHPIRLVFGKKITHEELKNADPHELREKVRNQIALMLEKYAFKKREK